VPAVTSWRRRQCRDDGDAVASALRQYNGVAAASAERRRRWWGGRAGALPAAQPWRVRGGGVIAFKEVSQRPR